MPLQAPQWTDFLLCHVCCKQFDTTGRQPVSLGCGHTVCLSCLSKLNRQQCPFDQAEIKTMIQDLPVNYALLQLVGGIPPETQLVNIPEFTDHQTDFDASRKSIEILTLHLKPLIHSSNMSTGSTNSQNAPGTSVFNGLTRQMQRKLVTLVNCQLVEEEGRCRAVRAARSLGERAAKELILLHQNPQHLSTNLWTAVRLRGCQFLGPAMQDEVLKYILLSLDRGDALCRKVLVLYVVQKLQQKYSQASKTSIGHVVQLLYRASCFKVTKREGESSLLQLQDKYRTFSALRKEHDAQIVKIAMEAGLHISPEQWSSLLYGDDEHKSHMQSIIDKLQTPESFDASIRELLIALQKTEDPSDLQQLCSYLERLAKIDPNPEGAPPSWDELEEVLNGLQIVIRGLVEFVQSHNYQKMKSSSQSAQSSYSKFKTRMCRDVKLGTCPRGESCNFAHSEEELKRHRRRRTPSQCIGANGMVKLSSSPDQGLEMLDEDVNGYRGHNDMQMPNGCGTDQMHYNGQMPQETDRYTGFSAGKTVQVSDAFVTRPANIDGSFSSSSPGYFMQMNSYQHYQTDNFPKRFQDAPNPAPGFCMPSRMIPQIRQPNAVYTAAPSPMLGGYPDNYGPMYPSVMVPTNVNGYSIYARGADTKDSKDDQPSDKGWGSSSSGLPGLSPSLDEICSSPISSTSPDHGSPNSQLLSGETSAAWGSLFGGKSDSIWRSSTERRFHENEQDGDWPTSFSLPRGLEPIGSRSSKDSITTAGSTSLEDNFNKASLYE